MEMESGESLGSRKVLGAPQPMRLRAYLASALTGLGESRAEILALQERIEATCVAHGFEVYRPAKVTDPVQHPPVTRGCVFGRP